MSILRVANLQFNASGTKRIDYDAVADDGIIKISAEAVRFPVGSNGTRPPSEPGLIRYNSDVGYMEFGGPTQWIQVASNSVYDVANAAFSVANSAYGSANNVAPQVTPAFNTANAAFEAANNVGPQIAPAFNTANAAYNAANNVNLSAPFNVANAAFEKANTALQNTNVTLAGNLRSTGVITLNRMPFYESTANINFDYTINTGMNAFTPGPVAIANGVYVTIPDGSYWSVT